MRPQPHIRTLARPISPDHHGPHRDRPLIAALIAAPIAALIAKQSAASAKQAR